MTAGVVHVDSTVGMIKIELGNINPNTLRRTHKMRISIGRNTEEAMALLGVKAYPFTSEELSFCFREKIKMYHSDTGGDTSCDKKAHEVITANKHLKNLAIDFEKSDCVVDDTDEDLFTLKAECPSCKGSKKVFREEWVNLDKCPECNDTKKVALKCKFCTEGKFKLVNGRIVDCKACKGTGIFKEVACRKCKEAPYRSAFLNYMFGHQVRHGEYRQVAHNCSVCEGKGKVTVKPFNPVIPKGAVL